MEQKKTKFKVELEIEVGYNIPEGVETTPYTRVFGSVIDGQLTLFADKGKIEDFTCIKLEREE